MLEDFRSAVSSDQTDCPHSNTQTNVTLALRVLRQTPYRHCTQTGNNDENLLMSRTKTNRWTEGEQYTRSNAATAGLLTLVNPAENLARD